MSTGTDAPAGTADVARVVLRPVGTPLPLGFLGLVVATVAFASVQLGWVPATQGSLVALGVLAFTVPTQLVACVVGFLARDPVAGTGMGVLAGTWGAVALVTLTTPPGASSPGLGVLLLCAAAALLVPATAGLAKPVAAVVMALSVLRFALTGVAEISGSSTWLSVAGVTGLVLGAVALYAALAFELEDVRGHAVLPLFRRGAGASAGLPADLGHVTGEAGVRPQL
ncbi:hypothetical protein [Cellulosimicrobium cellulans]|uniref:hypothetical protein n=1 Tax=Cellulosimicrobium cellulans TaxID=1710 RepID=UPI0008490ED3|nr:hypothetical protein [Cellulosimicrobium cellulans]